MARFDPFAAYGSIEARIFSSPHKYVQRKGLVSEFGQFVKPLHGKKAGLVGEKFLLDLHGKKITESFKTHAEVDIRNLHFGGECCWNEINRILKDLEENPVDYIVAFGGGKTIDTGKATAYKAGLPIVIAPTLASNDAPCSALSVIYTPTGEFEEYFYLPDNPYIVMVDTEIIVAAPKRFIVSGMGDAMSTFYEADAVLRAPQGRNMIGGRPTTAAMSIAKLCKDTLYEHGPQACADVGNKQLTKAVENVIEANTLLSGLGFESGGLAAAHALHNGLTITPKTHHIIHGEKVAFATIAQLLMEDNREEALRVTKFNKDVGLPCTLGDLGLEASDTETLTAIANRTLEPGESIHNMPFKITPEMIIDSMIAADKMGLSLKA